MTRNVIGIALATALLAWVPCAHGQRTTERFIPVGQSPGISGTRSEIGEIEAVDLATHTVTVAVPSGPRVVKVTEQTRIWLDRSAERLSNEVGSASDLHAGRRAEIKYVDFETKDTADWIKVVVPAGG